MEFPEEGEIVVIKVDRVLDYGAFGLLVEYNNLQGFIHISEVASGWVKNIRNYVKENQIRAGKVMRVDTSKNQVDVSFTKLSQQAEKQRLEEYKQFNRVKKLLDVLAKSQKSDFDTIWNEVAEPLLDEFGSITDAFKNISLKGKECCVNVPKKWVEPLVKIVQDNVSVPKKTIKGVFNLKSNSSDGVEVIKKSFKNLKNKVEDAELEVYYEGSGNYALKVTALNFKKAEKALKQASDNVLNDLKKFKGEGTFKRIE